MRLGFVLIALALVGCPKVPIVDVNAGFGLADASWFEAEQTLFFFYRVQAEQGLGAEDSVVEISYTTDDVVQPWIRVEHLTMVHEHVAADCGPNTLCGSASVHVEKPPRNIGIRLRYHKDGAMVLLAPTGTSIVRSGAPHTHRSFLVYGVFDATNTLVQWRGRHVFPAIRNEEAQALGLRRAFQVTDQVHGSTELVPDNPYAYGFAEACPADFLPTSVVTPVTTNARAAWNDVVLTLDTSTSSTVCARSTVYDALGPFEAVAVARKNPEVQPAFPLLRSPVKDNTSVRFILAPCNRTISRVHRDMQEQRIQLGNGEEICIDDWEDDNFVDDVAGLLQERLDDVRTQGRDMVLTLALHHDDASGDFAAVVEDILNEILPAESAKSSPRVSGAFVFDSYTHRISSPMLRTLVLWCPALFLESFGDDESIPNAAERSCALMPDDPTLRLGPFSFTSLPILPSRSRYTRFLRDFSDAQAGEVKSLTFRAPERTPISENVAVDPFGIATFFNNEIITAAPTDAFSFCSEGAPPNIVYRTASLPDVIPLALLPEVHNMQPEGTYRLGIVWDFPFLLRMRYETVIAGAASAFSLTVPFGIANSAESYLGTELWSNESFDLSEALLQCTRFCEHPTFDSAGVYNVLASFRSTYAAMCYRPRYPNRGDGGFPRDP